jgi:hypothetical protein
VRERTPKGVFFYGLARGEARQYDDWLQKNLVLGTWYKFFLFLVT